MAMGSTKSTLSYLEQLDQLYKNSIYWNALPNTSDRLDISKTDNLGHLISQNFYEQLIKNGYLDYGFKADKAINKKLEQLYHQTTNIKRLNGQQTFGFGFPFYIDKQADDLGQAMVAPIFIWYLDFEPQSQKLNGWHLKHNAKNKVVLNHKLFDYWEKHYQVDIKSKFQDLIDQADLKHMALSKLCNELILQLKVADLRSNFGFRHCPKADELLSLTETGAVHWSGIFGLFPIQQYEVYERVSNFSNNGYDSPPLTLEHHFGMLLSDPYQKQGLIASGNNQTTLINGISGTGKTYCLSNILTNALSNGLRCLVVSDRVSSLDQIQETLQDHQMGHLSFKLSDPHNDKYQLLDHLKTSILNNRKTANFDDRNFKLHLDRCLREHNKLDDRYEALNGHIFGENSWAETVGAFLASNKTQGKELLGSQLNPDDFSFNYSEYEILKDGLNRSKPLYGKINTLRHPLRNLNHEIFLHQSKEEGQLFIRQRLNEFVEKASQLQHQYINKIDEYGERLRDHYENHFQELVTQVNHLQENVADNANRFGDTFNEHGGLTRSKLQLYGVFSNRHKSILNEKTNIAQAYTKLISAFNNHSYFPYDFSNTDDGKNIPLVKENLDQFEANLLSWRQNIPSNTLAEIQVLNSQSLNTNLDFNSQIEDLEYNLDLLIEELNESGLFQSPLQHQHQTIVQRQQFLEDIIEKLEQTAYNMRDFDPFYDWQQNWLGSTLNTQKLIQAIVKVKPKDWIAAFESWYFHNRLTLNHRISLPQDDSLLLNFIDHFKDLKKIMPAQIAALWQNRCQYTFKKLKGDDSKQYQLLIGKNSANGISLREILHKNWTNISTAIPVLLTTSATVNEFFPDIHGHFDLVLIDDAHRIKKAHGLPLLTHGKRRVIFGNSTLDTASGDTSIHQHLRTGLIPEVELKYLHHNSSTSVLQFNKASIYDNEINLLRTTIPSNASMQVSFFNGIYNEIDQRNEEEAIRILSLLNTIKKTEEHFYPKVGIIAFTKTQRDLIATHLLKMKQLKAAGSKLVELLEEKGFGVYVADELQEERFDHVIISLTFGPTDHDGTLSRDIDFFNTEKGMQLLALLKTSFSRTIHICSSLKPETIDGFVANAGAKGTFLLGNYIQYAQAVEQSDIHQQKLILQRLSAKNLIEKKQTKKSVFINQVATALEDYFDPKRIHINGSVENLTLPLTIKPAYKHEPPVLIQADGFFSNAPTGAYLWEQYLRQEITFLGLQYYPTWSVNWWKNPKQEARKLAGLIIKQDEAFAAENQEME